MLQPAPSAPEDSVAPRAAESLFDPAAGLCAALDLLEVICTDLPGTIAHGSAALPGLDVTQVTDKLVAEALLLLLLAARAPLAPLRESQIGTLAARLTPLARCPRHYALLAANPQAVLGIGLGHVALNELGLANPQFDRAVRAALDDPAVEAIDRPNFRHLELAWLRGLHRRRLAMFGPHAAASLLNHQVHPGAMRREDGYAATHAAMYLTDFGRWPLPAQIPAGRVAYFCDHALAWCAAEEDWDLLGEVLIAGLCVRQPAALHGWAFSRLAEQFSHHSALFGPNCPRGAVPPGLTWRGDPALVLHAYHPTFVFGILCALELTLGPILPDAGAHRAVRPGDQAEASAQGELIGLIRDGPWLDLLDRLHQYDGTVAGRLAESCELGTAKLIRVIHARAAEG